MHGRFRRFTVPVITATAVVTPVTARRAFTQVVPAAQVGKSSWRLVGPFRVGWATMGAGLPIIKPPTLVEIHFEGPGEAKDPS